MQTIYLQGYTIGPDGKQKPFAFPISVAKGGPRNYVVSYGQQTAIGLNIVDASHEIGGCVMHALQCDGVFDKVLQNA